MFEENVDGYHIQYKLHLNCFTTSLPSRILLRHIDCGALNHL